MPIRGADIKKPGKGLSKGRGRLTGDAQPTSPHINRSITLLSSYPGLGTYLDSAALHLCVFGQIASTPLTSVSPSVKLEY